MVQVVDESKPAQKMMSTRAGRRRRAAPPRSSSGGAPPQAEAMDGKEEIRVVEEQPAWQGGSLESLDVIDKVPDESVKLATD